MHIPQVLVKYEFNTRKINLSYMTMRRGRSYLYIFKNMIVVNMAVVNMTVVNIVVVNMTVEKFKDYN